MHVLTAGAIRKWDQFTIEKQSITSLQLMERAAAKCTDWLMTKLADVGHFKIFCGKGNNGGDGLAIAQLLIEQGSSVSVFILESGKIGSEDFQKNLQRLQNLGVVDIHFLQLASMLPPMQPTDVIIDALYGTGLSRPLEGLPADVVRHINNSNAPVVSLDIPSGLSADGPSTGNVVVSAHYTITFQVYKTALLLAENANAVGQVHVLDMGLDPAYLIERHFNRYFLDEKFIRSLFKKRNRFSHKGSFGHALLVGGSFGKIGAMVLAAKACLHTGAGLTTVLSPRCGYTVLQTTVPEAMMIADKEEDLLSSLPADLDRYDAVGVGPGMGTEAATQNLLSYLIRRTEKPMVFDADALNIIAQNKDWLGVLPKGSILTPHPKEFDRLFGEHTSDFDRLTTASHAAQEHKIIVVLKGHHSFIALPDGEGYFNSTGNAGMAKGGSGDALTGILTALLAQGYCSKQAALLGVYLHGWAGDVAAKNLSQESMTPSDLISHLPQVFKILNDEG